MNDTVHSNRLIDETSPYLQQHAHNPVEWYPWGPEALEKARREDKPILLSIGYSACHWCHVMAHESFEDEASAAVMNELFVNIKVDREERPDLDKIYQTSYQLLNGRGGGWPLTMFLTPDDHVPFFGATYVPKEPRYGMPSFRDLLRRLSDVYRHRQDDIRQQNDSLLQALRAGPPRQAKTGYALHPGSLQDVVGTLKKSYDSEHGGFGKAPKFPHPTSIERLLRHWRHTEGNNQADAAALDIACTTLRKMAEGGIFDHLGGGFCRYSVDDLWMIPHFEKMLYDNGPLLALYSEAWRASGDALFKQIAEATAAWTLREMQSPEGGYYSALDADSDGEEGKYYVWSRERIRELLDAEEYAVFAHRFGLDRAPNFEGQWHLHAFQSVEDAAREAGVALQQAEYLLLNARNKLFAERERRIRPGRDEKILCAWNGLMIKGMAIAGRHLERPDLLESAERALDFIREHLWRDGRLLAVYKDGVARQAAYLDDYAFLIDGILELLQGRWRDGDLDFAVTLAGVLLDHFQDQGKRGGFFFTADDHERLIQRPKPLYDDALPCGNGIAAYVLIKLGHLLNDIRYLVAAERTLKWAWPNIEQSPMACNALLLALEEYFYPSETVILRGSLDAIQPWWEYCARPYAPRRLTLAIPAQALDLPEFLEQRQVMDTPVAYICKGTKCSAPVTSLDALAMELAQS